ncbi:type II toxin-antitoxin system PemK/MazF family toxin [Enterococcus sp. 669A]|uniref:Type II toxin-antitoxin system PemK/MazF family toxin n=1 Tax=Candidatus Enterococcus moelleringii TaxID=2815325 RepID=A0ABS3L7E8_9ENTE|nr:type II toxin-antitoxin system PemK/MazF family toxin [Enterococcus sp. 669A]MBO1305547.1 type II toxin-antitoxin system PemK/MazF family toxin [Enterococcus sp. 669A]
MVRTPMQGDILLLNTAPHAGHEQTGSRLYIVLSHKVIAEYSKIVIVAPISTTLRNYPLYIEIKPEHEMKTKGKVMLDQLLTIDYEARECKFLEKANESLLNELLVKVKAVFERNN